MEELFASGHSACAGCGETIAVRHVLNAAGKNTIVVSSTGCLEVVSSKYPNTSWKVPWIHAAFENAAAVASGVREALNSLGKEDVNVIAIGGDGGTFDIGLQALSGMCERGHRVLYVCIDNEAYMNTGIQRSSATPMGAWTTTSPPGKKSFGNYTWKKPIVEIIAAHHIPYAASASVAEIEDLEKKVQKALAAKGPSFLHVFCPCIPGWKIDSSQTIAAARLAVETGMWALFEIESGKLTLNQKPNKKKPVSEYFKVQGRFKHLKEKEIEKIQKLLNDDWRRLEKLEKCQ